MQFIEDKKFYNFVKEVLENSYEYHGISMIYNDYGYFIPKDCKSELPEIIYVRLNVLKGRDSCNE